MRHAKPPRGLVRKKVGEKTWLENGRFARFPPPSDALFTEDALKSLADKMVGDPLKDPNAFDPPSDGPDAEESGNPALYTYFGQFIDHDLLFDPASSFQRQLDADAIEDFRTPAFDLDSVYGRGPDDQPYMYDGELFELGDPLTLGARGARDLLRSPAGVAIIGDPRNDENTIVSQLQGLFHRMHNRLIREDAAFDDAQRWVRLHYQHVVLHDFLPRIVSSRVLEALKTNGEYDPGKLKLVSPESPAMPVEFSGACFRYGHSMVRPGYRLNDAVLLPIFPIRRPDQRAYPEGLTGFRRMVSDWGIDWARFIDVEPRNYDGTDVDKFRRLQLAYRIDTSLVDPLKSLPASVASDPPPSLAFRNLKRGNDLRLPSAQNVARTMADRGVDVDVLDDEKIIIGKAVIDKDVDGWQGGLEILKIDPSFEKNCPLWTYVLAEAMYNAVKVEPPVAENAGGSGAVKIPTPQLGPLGGRIVAEVIVSLMFADQQSVVYEPAQRVAEKNFFLRDLVAFALGDVAN